MCLRPTARVCVRDLKVCVCVVVCRQPGFSRQVTLLSNLLPYMPTALSQRCALLILFWLGYISYDVFCSGAHAYTGIVKGIKKPIAPAATSIIKIYLREGGGEKKKILTSAGKSKSMGGAVSEAAAHV